MIPVEELLGKLINARNMFFLIGFLVGIVFLVVNFIIANDIVDNINTLMVAMQKVAKGNLEAEYITDRTDEIGILGSSFGVMKENLKNYNEHLKEMVEEKTNELVVLNKKLIIEKELTEKTNKGLHITMETLKETQKNY